MAARFIGLLAVTAVATCACTAQPSQSTSPNAKAEYTPVVSLNEIMVYVVDPHSNEIWDAAVNPPTTDKGWAELQHAAVVLAASGNLTKLGGNGPKDQRWTDEADWARYSQAVADGGLAAVQAVRTRNTKALSQAGDQLVLTCINCHREYKLDVPAIWTERQFPPGANGNTTPGAR
jgi:hypothetical protein